MKREALEELRKHPSLEFTSFYNGFFMDYFGMPGTPAYNQVPFFDFAAGKAAIPGNGDENKVVFTHTKDVAKFVRKAVEEKDPWPEESFIVGDKVTPNEILQAAEKARGIQSFGLRRRLALLIGTGIKFDVVHDSLEDLRAGKITEIPSYLSVYEAFPKEFWLGMMAAFGVAMITGVLDLGEDNLNKKYPDIHPVKVADFITEHWAGK